MAYDDQKDNPLPVNGKSDRKSAELLPKYFRTESNEKFLNSTLDQVTKPGTAKKLKNYLKEAAILPPSTVRTAPVVFLEVAK